MRPANVNQPEYTLMNKDQVKGSADKAKGKAKETGGKALGNERMEGEGKMEKAGGKARSGYGDAKENIKRSTQ